MSIEPPQVAPADGPEAQTTVESRPAPVRRPGWSSLRPPVPRLHFYAAVLVAPFLLVAAATGLLYAGSYQAEKLLYAHELHVPDGTTQLPLSQPVAAARKAHPEGTSPAGGFDAHTGTLFGILNQLALAALALALILVILWGYRMWWQRGRAAAFGRPVPRGAWQHVPPHILVPLAAFLAADAVLSEIAHRRGKRAGTIAS